MLRARTDWKLVHKRSHRVIRACVGPSNDAMRAHTHRRTLFKHPHSRCQRPWSPVFVFLAPACECGAGYGGGVRGEGRRENRLSGATAALRSHFFILFDYMFPLLCTCFLPSHHLLLHPPLPLLQAASPPHPAGYMNEASKNKSTDWGEEGGPGNPRGVRLSQWPSVLLQLANMLITADTRLFLCGAVR